MNGVSIVIPTYNRISLLVRLLESIRLQTYKNYEIIIVDDNSLNIDKYNEIIEDYKEIFDELIYVRNNKNKGAPYSRNRGIKLAKFDLIALVDDDEEWLPNKLQKQVEVFESSSKKVGIVYTWANVIDNSGRIIYKYRSEIESNPIYNIVKENFICSASVMVKKKIIMEAGLFDENLPSCQDWDMWLRILKKGYHCKVVKELLTLSYKHDKPSIGKSNYAKMGFRLFYIKHFFFYLKILISKFDFLEILKVTKNIILF
ncbi:hypothetical protein LCGC14_1015690 [marine sediment metagenome]|uniref:Glycosyltransferase 2-like domain-containing protein n=1 Tax=marine sediment metagenome TaxID=412755 RepID=A0A0F9R4Z2_9ZZZZ